MKRAVAQRLSRLVRLVTLLASRPHRRRELAELFGVSERTMTKDLATLVAAGVRVVHTSDGYVVHAAPALTAPQVAPGLAVSLHRDIVWLVSLVPRGYMTWVERRVSPQPPKELLWRAVGRDRNRRALYPLTPELAAWAREHL